MENNGTADPAVKIEPIDTMSRNEIPSNESGKSVFPGESFDQTSLRAIKNETLSQSVDNSYKEADDAVDSFRENIGVLNTDNELTKIQSTEVQAMEIKCNEIPTAKPKEIRRQITAEQTSAQNLEVLSRILQKVPNKCIKCTKCFYTSKNSKYFYRHLRRRSCWKRLSRLERSGRRIQVFDAQQQDKSPSDKKIECELCNMNFISNRDLQKHRRIHGAEKRFKCNHCSTAFTDDQSRVKHERTHSDERPYKCPKCSCSFRAKATLKRHLSANDCEKGNTKPAPKKSSTCEFCGKKFKRYPNLQKYLKNSKICGNVPKQEVGVFNISPYELNFVPKVEPDQTDYEFNPFESRIVEDPTTSHFGINETTDDVENIEDIFVKEEPTLYFYNEHPFETSYQSSVSNSPEHLVEINGIKVEASKF